LKGGIEVPKYLPLDLQFFADGGDGGKGAPEGGDIQNGGQVGNDNPNSGQGQNGSDQGGNSVDVEALKVQAQSELLKGLGFDDIDSLKDVLTKYKEEQDAKKTEAEKQAEKLKSLQKQLSAKESENATLAAKVTALSKGVNAEALDDVIALAKARGGDDIEKAIDEVIAKYPHFLEKQGDQSDSKGNLPSFGQANYKGSTPQTELDKWRAAFGIKD
jgi:small-conductance mechanosensitive channel